MKKDLPVPPAALQDDKAKEMIRAWIADGGLHCSLNVGSLGKDEGTVWGILISDVARHVSNALSKGNRNVHDATLAAIRAAFEREMDRPTSPTKGSFIE